MTHAGLLTVGSRWRVLAALVAVVLALVPLGAAQAEDRLNMTVLSGENNVDAALAWSQHAFPATSTNAILGRSDLPPDNLASGLLQGALDAPLLLNPSTTLDPAVKAELERLEARTVHILGGLTAISSGVEAALRAEGYAIRRYAGATRIETAQEIAASYGGAATTALLARAFGVAADPTSAWADALAGGAWAADDEVPVLFTQTETLTASTRKYLEGSRVRTINILGGTAAVNDSVKAQLEAMGIAVKRVSGATRFATATAIAAERGYDDVTDAASVVLADGQHTDGWAAGFTAAGFAADKPIVLSNGAALPAETNTFLTGGTGSKSLIVAPYVTEAAANAAADKMGLLTAATVTLDATTFQNNSNITGKITPLDDVKSSAIAGPCVAAGTLSPNATTGAFSVAVAQNFAPGSCEVTITVTYKNDSTSATPFTITITGPGPNATVMDAPELVTVTFVSQTTDHVLLRYTFDEHVSIADNTATPLLFAIYGFNGSRFVPNAPTGDPVRPDTDTKSVLASYLRPQYGRSTTAVVGAGAVKSTQTTRLNPEGSRGIQAVSLAAGRTIGPDLTSVTAAAFNKGDSVAPVWVVRATYNFSRAATKNTSHNLYKVIKKDGADVPADALVSGDGTTAHVLEFNVAGANFATTELAQAFASDIRRGWVDADPAATPTSAVVDSEGRRNLSHTVPVAGGIMDSAPYLTSVALVPSTGKVNLTFNKAVTIPANQNTNYFVYDHAGTLMPSTTAALDTTNTSVVILTFTPPSQIDGQVTAAGYKTGAVTGGIYETLPASNGAHTFASGVTMAPDLQRVTRAASAQDPFGGPTPSEYKVTYRFNKDVTAVDAEDFLVYEVDGTGTPLTGLCVVGTTKTDVVCTIDDEAANAAKFTAVHNAVLYAVKAEAVKADGPNKTYNNYPTSKLPTAS